MNFIKKNFTGVVLAIGFLVFIFIGLYFISRDKPKNEVKTQVIYDISDPFSEQKVKDYLIQLHVKYPEVAVAQMELESANGTSNIFKQNNNLFGLKVPQFRPTTSLGTKNNHAYYSHWRQSILDYTLFCTYVMNQENSYSRDAWLDYLGKYYAADNSYKIKLEKIINSNKNENSMSTL